MGEEEGCVCVCVRDSVRALRCVFVLPQYLGPRRGCLPVLLLVELVVCICTKTVDFWNVPVTFQCNIHVVGKKETAG